MHVLVHDQCPARGARSMLNNIFLGSDFRLPACIREMHPVLATVMTSIDIVSNPSCVVTIPGTSIFAVYRQDGSLEFIRDVEVDRLLYRATD